MGTVQVDRALDAGLGNALAAGYLPRVWQTVLLAGPRTLDVANGQLLKCEQNVSHQIAFVLRHAFLLRDGDLDSVVVPAT